MKLIYTSGKTAQKYPYIIVDDDFEIDKPVNIIMKRDTPFARVTYYDKTKKTRSQKYLHHLILNYPNLYRKKKVQFINGNSLDLRKDNLQVITTDERILLKESGRSKNVYYHGSTKKFYIQIELMYKKYTRSGFKSRQEAEKKRSEFIRRTMESLGYTKSIIEQKLEILNQ